MTDAINTAASSATESFDDLMRRGLKAQLGEARFSAEDKERIAQGVRRAMIRPRVRAVNRSMHTPTARKRRPAMRFAIAVAAVVAAMGLGTFAYASGALVTVGDAAATLFGAGPAPTEVIDKVGRPIGAAQSVNGVTVSADAVIADGQNYSIVYSVQKDDGTPFEGLSANEYGYLNVTNRDQYTDIIGTFDLAQLFDGDENGILGSYGSSYFYDADPADPAIQMVEQMSMTSEHSTIIGKTAHARFGDFFAIEADNYEEPITIAAGQWNLAFEIDCEDASIAVPAGQGFHTPNGDATMESLTVSPIAVSMKYTLTPNGSIDYDRPNEFGDASSTGDLKVSMADGTEIDVHNPGGIGMSQREDGSIICDQNVFLSQIIDPEDIVSITIGGTVFSMK